MMSHPKAFPASRRVAVLTLLPAQVMPIVTLALLVLTTSGEGHAVPPSVPRCDDGRCTIPTRRADADSTTHPRVTLTSTELHGAEGMIELLPVRSPFGVAVTADGHQRYRIRATLRGLPDPASLGPYTTYVLWSATWLVQQTERIGPVGNGEQEMGEVRWNKFRILLTAERSPDVDVPTGPVIMRGSSPSGRMMPHDFCHLGYGGPC